MVAPKPSWRPAEAKARSVDGYTWVESVVEQYGPGIRRMLRRMLHSDDEAQEVYQECLYQLLKRSQELLAENPRAYAFRTAANLAVETIRRRRRQNAHWDRVVHAQADHQCARAEAGAGSPDASRPQRAGALRQAVGDLPRHLRDVVLLRDLAQMSYARVADLLGIRPTTARVYRRQAIVRLNGMLSGAGVMN